MHFSPKICLIGIQLFVIIVPCVLNISQAKKQSTSKGWKLSRGEPIYRYQVIKSLHPKKLRPVYIHLRTVLSPNDTDGYFKRKRDDFKIGLGISKRQNREWKLIVEEASKFETKRKSSQEDYLKTKTFQSSTKALPLTASQINKLENSKKPTPYNVTITRKKISKIPPAQPVIMIRDGTKKKRKNNSSKNQASRPPNIVLPSTGDVSEEDSDEEDEEEEDYEDDNESETSGEETAEVPKAASNQVMKMNASKVILNMKGESGAVLKDTTTAKKKSKKKKKAKKAELHFVPAPLGPKADLMIRLDKVHKNVKDIVSVVKGVFSDYVVNRPYVNLEINKGLKSNQDSYRNIGTTEVVSNNEFRPLSPPEWKNKYQKSKGKAEELSKRYLKECFENDDELCDDRSYQLAEPEPRPQRLPSMLAGELPVMPYPIYIESFDDESEENSPFNNLPPLPPSHLMKEEKNWVKTWDKMETGLPQIASPKEASKRGKIKKKGQILS